jgi:23S rRNA pseudouridine2457 synthase
MLGDRYFMLHKPVDMVSQFVSTHNVRLLGAIHFDFPEGTHAIGRLDNKSEGLLLLTTDKKITRLLFQGKKPHNRTYLVQVKYHVSQETIEKLASGVSISAALGGSFLTSPCQVELAEKPTYLQEPDIPLHKNIPYSWLKISLQEGKFHQVRKMVASVRHKCIRLIRISIDDLELGELLPGEVRELPREYFYEKLNLIE